MSITILLKTQFRLAYILLLVLVIMLLVLLVLLMLQTIGKNMYQNKITMLTQLLLSLKVARRNLLRKRE